MDKKLKLDCYHGDGELKELYPDGFENFFLDKITLNSDESGLTLYVWVQDKPAVIRDKWGKWNEDFNTVILQFSCCLNKDVIINNWQNNYVTDTSYRCYGEVSSIPANDYGIKDEKDMTIRFYRDNWEVKIVTKCLVFQSYNTKAVFHTDDISYL